MGQRTSHVRCGSDGTLRIQIRSRRTPGTLYPWVTSPPTSRRPPASSHVARRSGRPYSVEAVVPEDEGGPYPLPFPPTLDSRTSPPLPIPDPCRRCGWTYVYGPRVRRRDPSRSFRFRPRRRSSGTHPLPSSVRYPPSHLVRFVTGRGCRRVVGVSSRPEGREGRSI